MTLTIHRNLLPKTIGDIFGKYISFPTRPATHDFIGKSICLLGLSSFSGLSKAHGLRSTTCVDFEGLGIM